MIYIDCTECIPDGSVKYHGGANYGKRMIDLLSNNKEHIVVLLPTGFKIEGQQDESIFLKKNIELVYIHDLESFNGYKPGDILFLPLLPTRRLHIIKALKKSNAGVKIYVTIHGTRLLDLRPDYYDTFYIDSKYRILSYLLSIPKYHVTSFLYKRTFRKYIPFFDKVFTVSNDSLQKIIGICRPQRIKPFYCGSINMEVAKEQPLRNHKNYALIVSGGRAEKNLLRTLVAFQKFKETDKTGLRLVATGITDERKVTLLKCNQIGKSILNDVTLLPYVDEDELKRLYEKCKFVICLSKSEGFGLAMIESTLNGKPILTSSRTAMPEVLWSGAYYADPLDVNSIVTAFEDIQKDDYSEKCKQVNRRKDWVLLSIENSDKDFVREFDV